MKLAVLTGLRLHKGGSSIKNVAYYVALSRGVVP